MECGDAYWVLELIEPVRGEEPARGELVEPCFFGEGFRRISNPLTAWFDRLTMNGFLDASAGTRSALITNGIMEPLGWRQSHHNSWLGTEIPFRFVYYQRLMQHS
jgi:hypothetical protein